MSNAALKLVTGGGADIPRPGSFTTAVDGSKLGSNPPPLPDFPRGGPPGSH